MPILDRSKIRPEVLKSIDESQKIRLKGALEYLKFEENKGFNLQAYMQKIAEGNKKFFQILSNKEGHIEDLYGYFTDEEMWILAKFFRFVVDYYIKTELEKYPISEDVKIIEINAGGVPAEWQIVPGAVDDKVILYFHGGGFVLMSPKTNRALTIEIAQLTKMRVLSVDYRLAPEHPFPAQLEDCVTAYKWLLTQGFKAENIVIAGDSAGGNLTLTSLIKLRDEGIPLPAGAVALSPATDYTDKSETFYKNAKIDPILGDVGVFWWLPAFLAGEDPENPLISPLYADLRGLPPILLQVSTSEMLYDHSTRFADRAKT
ncbi:MAG: alpha/beta hydrolase, partial [Candidatus Lokiarchaeota archaeon]|nr:alpha/beta hydrolase [Candidatus Lokiarchaeota archaeon]